jgi:hypothetical protein
MTVAEDLLVLRDFQFFNYLMDTLPRQIKLIGDFPKRFALPTKFTN